MVDPGTAHLRRRDDIVLAVEHLVVEFPARGGTVRAVSDVGFDVAAGETLGLVGESGCGKSTTARAIMQVPPPTSGRVAFEGRDLTMLTRKELRLTRPRLQMIYQDPISSLNPRRKIRDIVSEGLVIWRRRNGALPLVGDVMRSVGIDPDVVGDRRSHELSGGECQRICIARSLVLSPTMLICDEPVSALDVSVQAQILNLLEEMRGRYGLTLLLIAHDLAVVKILSDRLAVMYLGKLCEIGSAEKLYQHPAHPYTRALMAAIPEPDPDIPLTEDTLAGDPPSPLAPPSGCRFRTRCPLATERCTTVEPEMREIEPDQFVACHFPHTGRATTLAELPSRPTTTLVRSDARPIAADERMASQGDW